MIKPKNKFDISILICTLHSRMSFLFKLYTELNRQSIGKSVQILWLGDNKSMSVGEKRNKLLGLSERRYIAFIDDDDDIEPDYLSEILKAIESGPDVITFHVDKYFNGQQDRTQKFSREYGKNHRSPDKKWSLMLPNHLCVWRKEVIKEKFPDMTLGEDWRWAELMIPHYRTEYHIDKILYTYNFNKETTETQ